MGESEVAVDPTDGHIFVVDNVAHGQSEHPEAVIDEFNPAGDCRGQIARWITHPEGEPGVSIEHHLTDGEPSGAGDRRRGQLYLTSGNFEAGEVLGSIRTANGLKTRGSTSSAPPSLPRP